MSTKRIRSGQRQAVNKIVTAGLRKATNFGAIPHSFVMFNIGENICGKVGCGKPREHEIHKSDV